MVQRLLSQSLVAILLLWPAILIAEQYPLKPVRIIVPAAPGGGTDLVARVLAQKLADVLRQQFIVDNRGGGGTTLGAAIVAKAPADGYTIMLHHVSLAFNASFYRRLSYDALKDFTPISLVAIQPFLVVVHPSLPVRSMGQLIALARSRPGEIAYGSGGAGSGPHMATELLKHVVAIDVLHVPYKGAGPAFTDLMGGQVQMMIATMSLALPHAKSGRVHALAITSRQRHPAVPLPTVAESGAPDYEFAAWYGLLAPRGVADTIIKILNDATVKVIDSDDIRKKLEEQGLQTIGSSPAEFRLHIHREVEKWRKVVQATGLRAD